MHKQKLYLILGFLIIARMQSLVAVDLDYAALQSGYINNDRTLAELEIKKQQAVLSAQKTFVQNGATLSVNTGTMSTKVVGDNTEISLSPNATIDLPALNDSSVTLKFPLSVTPGQSDSTEIDNAGVTLSTAIISKNKKSREVTLQKAERSVLEATRAVEKQKLSAQKEFLTELRALYSLLSEVVSAKNTVIEEQLDFDEIKIQGYSATSSKYRTASLEVQKAQRTVAEKQREFQHKFSEFAKNCGLENYEQLAADVETLVVEIPAAELKHLTDWDKELYSEIESAKWTNKINTLSREADIPFTLYADGGYSFSKDNLSSENDISMGLTAAYNGLSVSAGTVLPIEDMSKPGFTLSFGWDMSTAKTKKIEKSEYTLAEKIEAIAIEDALEAYDDELTSTETSFRDLIWDKQQNEEQLAVYAELEKDMKNWFERGVITSTEYRQAQTNYESAQIDCVLTKIDYLLHNIELSLLFIMGE